MTTTRQRLSPLDFDLGHDEELPVYEESTAPAYDSVTFDDDTIFTYYLRQYDRKIQVLAACGPPLSTSYRITSNSFHVFSKKPDLEVLYTSHEMRQRSLATIVIDRDGTLPWRPRAHFDHVAQDGTQQTHHMESANFADWTFAIGNRTFTWALDVRPVSLVFTEVGLGLVIARFTYSSLGTAAMRGGEVGKLCVYRDAVTGHQDGIDKAVCGLMVALRHLKKMGRHYSNEPADYQRRESTLTRELSPLYRA